MNSILQLDGSILVFLQEYVRTPLLTAIMVFFSTIGDKGAVWLITGAIFAITKKYRRDGIYMILDVAFCFVIANLILKNIVARPRPYDELSALVPLVARLSDWSFPSGHTCASFAAAYALTYSFGKKGAWSYVAALLIGFSRLYVGVHYPTDVLGGALVGTLGSIVFYSYFVPRLNKIRIEKADK